MLFDLKVALTSRGSRPRCREVNFAVPKVGWMPDFLFLKLLLRYILTVENIIIVDLDLKIREDVLHIEIWF